MQGDFYLLKSDAIKQNVINQVSDINTKTDLMCVKIEPFNEPRTDRQNRYLWGWVYKNICGQLNDSGQSIALNNGGSMQWSSDLLHEAFKTVFLELPSIETKKGTIKQYKSTTKLSTKEFSEYLENIHKAVSSWWVGISIPLPRGQWEHIYESIK